ncbi:MAG: carboxypeptidase-like regulatory domain-containing protein [Gemmatimonas sp.]
MRIFAIATLCVGVLVGTPSFALAQPRTGTLSGAIKQEETGTPVAGVEISLPDLSIATRSDSAGNFRLSGITVGKHRLLVRRVGLEPVSATLTMPVADSVEADILMRSTATQLQRITIRESFVTRRLADFESRRRMGFGYFVTKDVFDQNADRPLASTLSGRVPGVRFINTRAMMVAMSTRGNCAVQVLLNGVPVYSGYQNEPLFDLSSLQTAFILGLEYYTPSTTPMQYRGTSASRNGSGCGTLLLWTR